MKSMKELVKAVSALVVEEYQWAAILGACELVRVAAMADKAVAGLRKEMEHQC